MRDKGNVDRLRRLRRCQVTLKKYRVLACTRVRVVIGGTLGGVQVVQASNKNIQKTFKVYTERQRKVSRKARRASSTGQGVPVTPCLKAIVGKGSKR